MGFKVIQPASQGGFRKIEERKPGVAEEISGAVSTLTRSVPFLDEVNDRIYAKGKTGVDLLTGKAKARPGERVDDFTRRVERENYEAAQGRTKAASQDFEARRPKTASAVKGVGLAAQALPVGGAGVAPTAAGLRGLMGSSARAATAAGLSAQVAGYGGEGTLRERQEAANNATPTAMAVGAAFPVVTAGAGKARQKIGGAARATAQTGVRLANRGAKRVGANFLDPRAEAAKRLGEALKADGLGPQEIRGALQEWQASGASSPMLMNLGGENTRSLLRAAAAKPGGARNLAVKTVNRVEADLQPAAMARTRALTPDTRGSALQVGEMLEDVQGRLAREQYAEPYAAQLEITPQIRSALSGRDGHAAISRAARAAEARRDGTMAEELRGLQRSIAAGDDAPAPFDLSDLAERDPDPTISGAALDRIQIALGKTARGLVKNDASDIAAGLYGRQGAVNAALDDVPGLAPARASYRGVQAQRDALELGGNQPFNDPDLYESELASLTSRASPDDIPHPVSADDIQAAAGVGLRSELERMIGAPAENSTGTLNKLATGTNTGRVLETTFGGDEAASYRDALQREIDKVSDARFISPNSGPKTANVLLDQLIEAPPMSRAGIAKALFDKLRRGVTLTDEERQALLEIGTTLVRTGDDLPKLPTTPQAMRLLTPAQRARLSQVLAAGEGARRGQEVSAR